MKRTTITLPEDLAWALAREAKRRSTSASNVVRDALTSHFQTQSGDKRRIRFAGIGDSGYTDISERVEEILDAEYVAHIERHRDR